MRSFKWAAISGFLAWLVPFAVAVVIAPIRASDRLFFESIMPVVLSGTAVVLSLGGKTGPRSTREGLILGGIWLVMSIGLDLPMLMTGPMQMSFGAYMKDIGFTYLIYPVVAVAIGRAFQKAGK